MASHQNVIELNGNHYDASTGQLIKNKHEAPQQQTHEHQKTRGHAIDGISRRKHAAPSTHHKSPRPAAAPSHSVHHKNVRSKTLMRKAVQKPQPHQKPKSHDEKQHFRKATPLLHSTTSIDVQRIKRASHTPKSNLISKFGDIQSGLVKRVVSMEVRPAPKDSSPVHSLSAAIDMGINPDPLNSLMAFDQALRNADGHKQNKLRKPSLRQRAAKKLRISPKTLNVAAGVFVTIFIGVFIAYRNMPQLAFRVASTRAGIKATLPSYQPSGFSMAGPIQYSSGVVSLSYASNSDERSFRVVQKGSDWNSQSLLENFVATREPYQTFQDKGRTIYIYDGSNATWVSGGIWYQIEGESDLNSDQLLRIVSGL